MRTLSIILVRKNRPFYNWCELKSIEIQHFPKDKYEIVVIDDSSDEETPKIFKEFSRTLPIRYFHFLEWKGDEHLYVGPTGKLNLSVHRNFAIRNSSGSIVLMDVGEHVHLGETLYAMTDPHISHPNIMYRGAARIVDDKELVAYTWTQHPEELWKRDHAWLDYRLHPGDEDSEGYGIVSLRRKTLDMLGGFDETPQNGLPGWDCEDEEIVRRSRAGDVTVKTSDKVLFASLEDSSTSVTLCHNSSDYRGKIRHRLRKDAGYHGDIRKHPYYRPGSDLPSVRANACRNTGTLPAGTRYETWESALL